MFTIRWTDEAQIQYDELKAKAEATATTRQKKGKTKSSKQEGLFKQVRKAIALLAENPKHPGLKTHEYSGPGLEHPYEPAERLFEAYAQNSTPGAYRVFWCYGPEKGQVTIVAITPHP